MTDQEPFSEFIEWWDDPKVQHALREASDYTKAKSAFYAAWARACGLVPAEAHRGGPQAVVPLHVNREPVPHKEWPPPGPPPVTRIGQYAFVPGRFEGASEPGLPDTTNPGFPVTDYSRAIGNLDMEPGHEG